MDKFEKWFDKYFKALAIVSLILTIAFTVLIVLGIIWLVQNIF